MNSIPQILIRLLNADVVEKYGIFFLPHKLGAISVEHDNDDITQLIDASSELAREIRGSSYSRI